MDEKKVPLSDSLVKVAAWTHNTSVNKLGYCPLQLVTEKAVAHPGLATGNIATESLADAKAVQRTMENLAKIMAQFCETEMRQKLKDCQEFWTSSSNHNGGFIEGDKVWFQPLNITSWLGPAAVVC